MGGTVLEGLELRQPSLVTLEQTARLKLDPKHSGQFDAYGREVVGISLSRDILAGLASDACGEVCEQQVHDDLLFDGHQVIKHRVHQVRVPRSSCLSSRRREPFWTLVG